MNWKRVRITTYSFAPHCLQRQKQRKGILGGDGFAKILCGIAMMFRAISLLDGTGKAVGKSCI